MKKLINASLIIAILGLAIMLVGCGGKEVAPTLLLEGEEEDIGGGIQVPAWFLDIPDDPNYLYATATSTSKDLQLALDEAKNGGRTDIAGQIATKVQALFKRFREEVGVGDDAELLAQTTAVSKEVVSEVISGSRTAKQDVRKESAMSYRAYVLMEMPIGVANAALIAKVKDNKDMYTRFRASQGFKDLESEVEKYEEWKKEQGM